jgi:predicted permease
LLGRALTERDEQPGAPPVVVISYVLWKSRFDADPAVLGRTVKLGTTSTTIVGVMPEGFGFPVNERIWAPLRENGAALAPRTGPAVSIFGRLAHNASMEDAQAELSVIGRRMSASNPKTHEHLMPRVTAYAKPIGGTEMQLLTKIAYVVNGIFLLLLSIVCVNVATLVFARTATRGYELTVRTALGASRGRIISQLFIEALVLAGLAALVGLLIAKISLRFALGMFAASDALPYWIDDSLSWRTVLWTGVLTLFGAAIVGILPALRVTKINVHDALRSESAARSGLRFGGFWTAVIVAQVAITVALIPLAGGGVFESNRFNQRAEGIGAEHYLMAGMGMDREYYAMDSTTFAGRARASIDALERRLRAEPGVQGVAFADRLPVEDQFKYRIEVDSTTGVPRDALRTSTLVHVSGDFFATFGTSVIAGRDFTPTDFESNGRVMIVNEAFARYVLGGRNPIGQRIRILGGEVESVASKDWYEIVGMVKNFGWQLPEPREQSAMYRPSLPLVGRAGQLAVRVRDPDAVATQLRTIAADVDPTIRLTDVQPLAKAGGGEAKMNWTLTWVAWLVSFVVLMLSATGIHALMSFTVSRRTREIGIRAALGASQTRIVTGIFSRAFLQISVGLLVGSGLAVLMGVESLRSVLLLLAADAIMLFVGLTACALPLRRALRIDPTEALRAEG